jgi:hypothetical protein
MFDEKTRVKKSRDTVPLRRQHTVGCIWWKVHEKRTHIYEIMKTVKEGKNIMDQR